MRVVDRQLSVVRCPLSVAAERGYPMPRTTDHGQRTALTLIELLVVIVILVTIVAAAIPIMSPANDDRRLREASRGLNTFITGAQTRAIAAKRPFGIALKRLSQDSGNAEDNGVCLEVFYVEQPPSYAGFDANSRARVSLYEPANSNWYDGLRPLVLIQFVTRGNSVVGNDGLPLGWDADYFPPGMVRPRDIIELNGTRYLLLSDSADTNVEPTFVPPDNTYFASDTGKAAPAKATQIVAMPVNDTGQLINIKHDDFGNEIGSPSATNVPFFTYPAPYKIFRQAAPTSDEPYQLPEGTAVDLRASGLGVNDYFYVLGTHDNAEGVIIMFTPEGRVSRLSYSQAPNEPQPFDAPVVDNIFLLVGKRENVPAPPVSTEPTLDPSTFSPPITQEQLNEMREPINWLSGNSRWIVIGSQSGRIVTVENAFVDPLAVLNDPQPLIIATPQSEEMRTRQILAAREFTREMAQLGGR